MRRPADIADGVLLVRYGRRRFHRSDTHDPGGRIRHRTSAGHVGVDRLLRGRVSADRTHYGRCGQGLDRYLDCQLLHVFGAGRGGVGGEPDQYGVVLA